MPEYKFTITVTADTEEDARRIIEEYIDIETEDVVIALG